jgi:hypothetical protein
MVTAKTDEFAQGGLGRYADRLDVRVLFLPSDPEADVVPLDADVLAWLKEERTTPYGSPAVFGPSEPRHEQRAGDLRSLQGRRRLGPVPGNPSTRGSRPSFKTRSSTDGSLKHPSS